MGRVSGLGLHTIALARTLNAHHFDGYLLVDGQKMTMLDHFIPTILAHFGPL